MPLMARLQDIGSAIPARFCWTKYGTEAGEAVERILARKERERAANRGLFLWGIGNSISPSLRELLKLDDRPEIIFTPMLSRPAKEDSEPAQIARWRGAWDMEGQPFGLPRHSVVTSRFTESRPRHYALVCYSEGPLRPPPLKQSLYVGELRNLARGTNVAPSQVTSVVERTLEAPNGASASYTVGFRATLHAPYFVRLADPLVCAN